MKPEDPRVALTAQLKAKIAGKAKPHGALGRLEDLAVQIGLATGSLSPDLGSARLLIFTGDHGITAEGISAYPSAVTREIVKLVLAGKAGANICSAAIGIETVVVDSALLQGLPDQPGLISSRIRAGTRNARREAAMTTAEYQSAFDAGRFIVRDLIKQGAGLFALGEIGIGNSTSAALLAHAATDIPLGSRSLVPPTGR